MHQVVTRKIFLEAALFHAQGKFAASGGGISRNAFLAEQAVDGESGGAFFAGFKA
jgi:hypothetical protein